MTTTDTTFASLGLAEPLQRALDGESYTIPTPIQAQAIPVLLQGRDLLGIAQTGTGKTAAFALPILHSLTVNRVGAGPRGVRALVLAPTRELAIQIAESFRRYGRHLAIRQAVVFGGVGHRPQMDAMARGVDVLIATPGRLLDLMGTGHVKLDRLTHLVLDEADRMLDMGFIKDVRRIVSHVPSDRQSMLFSATMPGPIITLARTFMNQPTHIRAEAPQSSQTHDTTEQFAYRAHALDKVEMVGRILQAEGRGATMIFTRTKRTAQKVADELAERGFKVGAVHGDLGQIAREKALKAFRTGEVDVLVATDVAARGIDIDDITHVINYQIPEDEQAYVHRIGRTGRAGKTGIAVTLVDWDELPRWTMIDKALGLNNPDPVETYSSSPHLFEELKIPADATGSIAAPRKTTTRTEGERTERVERTERPARSRNRTRQRTRAGQPATGHPEGDTAPAAPAGTESPAAAEGSSDSDGADAPAKRRRRRRPRKSSTPAAG